mmetsp:Transcript_4777/g.11791  ORF Transcript_4777/g.11791 Transcript_4777/m.11791 type:complete len:297 (-) Transcript_4777:468-1358(-)
MRLDDHTFFLVHRYCRQVVADFDDRCRTRVEGDAWCSLHRIQQRIDKRLTWQPQAFCPLRSKGDLTRSDGAVRRRHLQHQLAAGRHASRLNVIHQISVFVVNQLEHLSSTCVDVVDKSLIEISLAGILASLKDVHVASAQICHDERARKTSRSSSDDCDPHTTFRRRSLLLLPLLRLRCFLVVIVMSWWQGVRCEIFDDARCTASTPCRDPFASLSHACIFLHLPLLRLSPRRSVESYDHLVKLPLKTGKAGTHLRDCLLLGVVKIGTSSSSINHFPMNHGNNQTRTQRDSIAILL